MRKFILLCLLINLHLITYTQVIKGTILDKQTKKPIEYASVYFSGTFAGTTSDQNGKFELDISKNPSMPLTISFVGYYSYVLTDFSAGKPLFIYLTPKINELNEVVISAESLARIRKEKLKLFKNEFLGLTTNAKNCEITNEDDIKFNYGNDGDTLKAFASKPILINNKALGYKITYYLDKFEYDKKSKTVIFVGNIIFTEDLTVDKTQKKVYEKKRINTFLGSRMHFFRSLWSNELQSNKFIVKNSNGQVLSYKNIVNKDSSNKAFLNFTENLIIDYYSNLSAINFLKNEVFFDKNGYFDPTGINWIGEMAKQRVADLLPYEYTYGEESPVLGIPVSRDHFIEPVHK